MPELLISQSTPLHTVDDFSTVNASFTSSKRLAELKALSYCFGDKKIVEISSDEGHGPVIEDLAQESLLKLQERAASGVKFDKFRLENSCWGGTCSAQSLNFADLVAGSNIRPLHQRVVSVAQQNTTSSLKLRTQQAALNAIAKDESVPVRDFSRAKIESIVAFRDFKVDFASKSLEEIVRDTIDDSMDLDEAELDLCIYQTFHSVVNKLPDGMYFTRMLCNADNYKEEFFGHSLVYVKDENSHYLFDPSDGLHKITNANWQAELFKLFSDISGQWMLSYPRFYHIVKKDPLSSKIESVMNEALSLKLPKNRTSS